ncbi:hypothetical protein [Polyangium jinanense]|uniref:Uncharacterized protein n=1 Tax=Polyangium jinanense TaxID=2829994 RepID=A0A9X3X6A2_9BACT|nr:hypothetical protein [Polyangium jinanense]MDC3957507.1 hypothetical protein [Polyangium jinanense]MDC3985002.1 hypothetical protein [Polyangium jinanense]
MRALCPSCGFHHEVVRVLEDGHGESRKDVYQVAPLAECERTWISDQELLEARARFGAEAIVQDDEYDV